MKLMKTVAATGVLALMSVSTIASAEATRAAAALPAAGKVVTASTGVRGSRRPAEENSIIGAPLLIALAVGAAATVTTVAVSSGGNDRPGG